MYNIFNIHPGLCIIYMHSFTNIFKGQISCFFNTRMLHPIKELLNIFKHFYTQDNLGKHKELVFT